MIILGSLNHQRLSFGKVLGASLGSLGVSWALLARLGRVWGVPWVHPGVPDGVLEASWGHFEASWGHFGTSWEDLGGVLGSLGGFLGPFWEHFWRIFCHLDQYAKIAKNLRKPMVFHRFSWFWEGYRNRKIQKLDENLFKEAKRRQK